MLWRDVFIPDSVVAGDGFTAQIGGVVEMPLQLYCRYRTAVQPGRMQTPGGRYNSRDRFIHDLIGRVADIDSTLWADGWMIDVGGLGIYVSEASASLFPGLKSPDSGREAGSDPPSPGPAAGSWVRVRGELSVAQPYETEAYEPAGELLRRAERQWLVRRIVRLDVDRNGSAPSPPRQDVPAIRFEDLYRGGRLTLGYLLDLEEASSS